MKFAAAALALVVLLAGACSAAEGQFRVDANVVLINATVLDRHDRPVRGLTRDRFRLFEDKTARNIAYFSEEEVPLSLAVIFDVSGSMQGKLAGMRAALNAVLQSSNARDEFSLVTFSDQPQVAVGWDSNGDSIQNRLLLASAHGQTSLLDAIETGLATLKKASNPRKAMLIFSDGGDNHSRATEKQILRSLSESEIQIYAIDMADGPVLRTPAPEEINGPDLLDRICDHAGGRYFEVDGKSELTAAAQQIARELKSQYLIGYVPAVAAQDGRFHHVRLEVTRPQGSSKVTVFWRHGYREPIE